MARKSTPSKPPTRKPRADAQRNRERILATAKRAFNQHGVYASLDDIAKRAKVGPGTLYRHFPSRMDLLAAVYSKEVEKLATAAQQFATTQIPTQALRSWLLLFVDYLETKLILAPALSQLVGTDACNVYTSSGHRVADAITTLVQRAIQSKDIRPDIDPLDLLRAIIGVANIAANPNWPQSARQFVDILLQGIKP